MAANTFNPESLVRENVGNLKPYSSARDEYVSDGSEMIFLDANENPFENGVNRYPDPHQRALRSLLADLKGTPRDQILLGNGSDEVLDLFFRAFCEPRRDNVISLPPTYGMYQVLSAINAVEHREVPLTQGFQPDVPEIMAATDRNTKLIFICSPNNPSGNSLDGERIKSLLDSFRGLVVIDEAYIDFSAQKGWLPQLDNHPNLVVTQTLSKAYGMAGIRLGICYASPQIISILNKIKPPYNVNQLTQQRAYQRLMDPQAVEREVAAVLEERKKLAEALRGLDFVEKVFPTDANFLLVRVDDADRRYRELVEHRIVVRNRSKQPNCENTLRFTVGTPKENETLIQILKKL